MPADISFIDGKAEAFTSLKPAWWDHDGDYLADRHLTSEEIWGERGLLNFEFSVRPIFDEGGLPISGHYRTVRQDTGATVGSGMTNRYKLVQPRQAFEWMDSLMSDGVMKYASAGVLKSGREIWILGVIPDAEETPIHGEHHDKFILWTDRFDGGGALKWFPCATRVECANTLALALGERDAGLFRGIRHAGDMEGRLIAARNAIIDAKEAFRKYNANCLRLIGKNYRPDQAREFVERLFPKPLEDASQRAKTIRARRVQSVRDAFRDTTNNLGDMAGSWYQLANAITFAVDHGEIFAFRGSESERQDNRFISLMRGEGAALKQRAFALALDMAG